MAGSVQALLDQQAPQMDPRQADTAIFYSISNTQKGLKQISFGDYPIKRVVQTLSREFPRLKIFATLTPITGFRRWLDALTEPELAAGFTREDLAELPALSQTARMKKTLAETIAAPAWG